ncbi:MAG TPA: hypothetical protein VI756_09470 [Blastocatellia bacterium]
MRRLASLWWLNRSATGQGASNVRQRLGKGGQISRQANLGKGAPISQKLRAAFEDNRKSLPEDKEIALSTKRPGAAWELTDNKARTAYSILMRGGGQSPLKLQDTTHRAPPD